MRKVSVSPLAFINWGMFFEAAARDRCFLRSYQGAPNCSYAIKNWNRYVKDSGVQHDFNFIVLLKFAIPINCSYWKLFHELRAIKGWCVNLALPKSLYTIICLEENLFIDSLSWLCSTSLQEENGLLNNFIIVHNTEIFLSPKVLLSFWNARKKTNHKDQMRNQKLAMVLL